MTRGQVLFLAAALAYTAMPFLVVLTYKQRGYMVLGGEWAVPLLLVFGANFAYDFKKEIAGGLSCAFWCTLYLTGRIADKIKKITQNA